MLDHISVISFIYWRTLFLYNIDILQQMFPIYCHFGLGLSWVIFSFSPLPLSTSPYFAPTLRLSYNFWISASWFAISASWFAISASWFAISASWLLVSEKIKQWVGFEPWLLGRHAQALPLDHGAPWKYALFVILQIYLLHAEKKLKFWWVLKLLTARSEECAVEICSNLVFLLKEFCSYFRYWSIAFPPTFKNNC